MSSNKKYWKSEAELSANDAMIETLKQNEFVEQIPTGEFLSDKQTLATSNTNRRDFLKYVGFSTAAASLAACEGPVIKSIPYVVQPEQIIPGVANFYATTIANGFDFASILVKTREGRPIKVENNKDAQVKGTANARVQASILSLYDSARLQGPLFNGAPSEWSDLDAAVVSALANAKASGKKVVFLTPTYASPSMSKLVAEFAQGQDQVSHVVYDAISESAALDAFEAVTGERALADYHLEKASVIVSFGADFLGDWQGGGFDAGYAKGRIPSAGQMSQHFQFESNMTLSGAASDKRVPSNSAQQAQALAALYEIVTTGATSVALPENIMTAVKAAAKAVVKAGDKAVVLTGIDSVEAQSLVLDLNASLESVAFDMEAPRYVRGGSVKALQSLVAEMSAGGVGLLVIDGVNPVYSLPNAAEFKAALSNVGTTVAFSTMPNETTASVQWVGAASHYLESWGDVAVKKGHYSLTQPTIKELFDTRQFQTALMKWTGIEGTYYDYIKNNWEATILGASVWNKALHDGVYVGASAATKMVSAIDASAQLKALKAATAPTMELVLYAKTGMGDGQEANNPWLQEFPDPITRVSWDNYATVSKADAASFGLVNENVANGGLNGSYISLTVNGATLSQVPVIIQPGQAPGTIGLALGYGKTAGLKEEMQVGVNAFALYNDFSRTQEVSVAKEGGMHEFACVQLHKTLMGRGDIIKETTLEVFNTKDAKYWNPQPMVSLDHQEVEATSVDLWDSFDRSIGHHFNLSIDLNACTGCGACVIACHAENNVPVVGKEEIRKSRDMHWLRIDRYYSSEDTFEGDNEKKDNFDGLTGDNGSLGGFGELEDPSANPQVAFQPVMCQHCNHAPCETVCPVAATSHSRQGQNHMAYNRCVGTRYCANNCPYKVRRFNWFLYNNNDEFDYHMNNDLGKMVINPDVNVRSRGVMEKCSMCIQKTQKTILDAKRDGREIKDGEFQTACSAACGNGAMAFGDINDKHSKVATLKESDRMYHLLEHVGTKPNVIYHVKVRNTTEA
ncbi:TAT-variant-translocated molybdopterin oxidoreductase [Flavobacteriaceae bacterium]|nr:TAT-variant-translocated molybdopterin oxidoreductase [Flavobacteriaceae bacterium]